MKTFEELREELIFMNKRDINMNSPIKQIALLKAKSKNDLLRIITSNWYFVFEGLGDFNSSYFEDNFTEEELREACIYTKKEHAVNSIAFACGCANIKAYGLAEVYACESVKIKAYDYSLIIAFGSGKYGMTEKDPINSFDSPRINSSRTEISDYVMIKAFDNAKIYVKGNSSATAFDRVTVNAYNRANVKAYGFATVMARDRSLIIADDYATVRAEDSAYVYANGFSNIIARNTSEIKARDNATIHVFDSAKASSHDKSCINDHTGKIKAVSDQGTVKDLLNNKIYMNKGKLKVFNIK